MYRAEYPRPQFVRSDWLTLNGTWGFAFDDEDLGLNQRWYRPEHALEETIEVPFAFQSELSGINRPEFHDVVWYTREFRVPASWGESAVILHFGAVDYRCSVWVNGQLVGFHQGGQVGFGFDITRYLTRGDETVTVRVEDPSTDETIARGKQSWREGSWGVWYTRTTGIWQTVWLEPIPASHIANLRFTADVDHGAIQIDYEIAGFRPGMVLGIDIFFEQELIARDHLQPMEPTGSRTISLFGPHILNHSYHGAGRCWTPETPNLFDLTATLTGPDSIDTVTSYFGMRKISCKDGIVYLNNQPYYQKLVLDQGYWPQSLLTASCDDAFAHDIEMAKAMGFNGCRKHQKVEDPRFLYWADKLGYLVWGECASAPCFTEKAVEMGMREWAEIITRDYNHPSIVTWVPLNESWGVPTIAISEREQAYSLALYHFIHALDPTRLVISNDGWEHTRSDLITVHNYSHGDDTDVDKFASFRRDLSTREQILGPKTSHRQVYASGFTPGDEPILVTEFGGMSYDVAGVRGWGYTSVSSQEEFVATYRRLMEVIADSPALFGFCYTQLTDVEQEINGLMTYDRQPKCDPKTIRALNQMVDFRWD